MPSARAMELARRAEKALGQAHTQEQRIDTIALWLDLAVGELTEQILQDTGGKAAEFSKQLIRAVVGEIIERPLERDAD